MRQQSKGFANISPPMPALRCRPQRLGSKGNRREVVHWTSTRSAPGRLREASRRPGPSRHDERSWRQDLAAALAQLGLKRRLETDRVASCGSHAERERVPPILEARMLDADGENALLDLLKPSCLEEPGQVALAGARKLRFVHDLPIELARRVPEQTERPAVTAVVPNTRG